MSRLRYDPEVGWTFDTPLGPRVIRDPDGLASSRQLRLLAARGLLKLRDRPGEPLTKLDAARAIDGIKEAEEFDDIPRFQPPDPDEDIDFGLQERRP